MLSNSNSKDQSGHILTLLNTLPFQTKTLKLGWRDYDFKRCILVFFFFVGEKGF